MFSITTTTTKTIRKHKKKKGNMAQTKGQTKTTETNLKEMEVCELPDK
jgi:hypothetical protein